MFGSAREAAMVALIVLAFAAEVGAQERPGAVLSAAFPNQPQSLYIEVPDAGNPVSNLMLGSVVTKSGAYRGLTTMMALGAESPTYLAVGGRNGAVVRKTLKAALMSFKSKQLPYLHLVLVGDPGKGEALRSQAEALGVAEYRVVGAADVP